MNTYNSIYDRLVEVNNEKTITVVAQSSDESRQVASQNGYTLMGLPVRAAPECEPVVMRAAGAGKTLSVVDGEKSSTEVEMYNVVVSSNGVESIIPEQGTNRIVRASTLDTPVLESEVIDIKAGGRRIIEKMGSSEVMEPHCVSVWVDEGDDVERLYHHENVRGYRRRHVKSSREWKVFVDRFLSLGEGFYYGDFLYSAAGNKIWTWKLYQPTPFMVSDLRAKTQRKLRKCGNRVQIAPMGVNPLVLEMAQRDYPRVGLVRLRRALSTIAAPKALYEYEERRAELEESIAKCHDKYYSFHHYKDQLTLVMEGIEPNPGPTYQECKEMISREMSDFDTFCSKSNINKEEVRSLKDIMASAFFHRVASYGEKKSEQAVLAQSQLIKQIIRPTEEIYNDLRQSQLTLVSDELNFVPASGITGGEKPWNYTKDFTVRYLTVLCDLVMDDCELKGSAFTRYTHNIRVLLGKENKSTLFEEMPITDPRQASQQGANKANIAPAQTNLVDQGGRFTREVKREDSDKPERKREARRKIWSSETAVPLGLLDLARYVYHADNHGPFAIYGIYKGLVETHKKTGEWTIEDDVIRANIDRELKREKKLAEGGLSADFDFDESMFPFYFCALTEADKHALKQQELEYVDTVSTDPYSFPVRSENVFELEGCTSGDEVVLKARALSAPRPAVFRFPKRWFKMASKRCYGCTDTYRECLLLCRTYVSWTDHEGTESMFSSYEDLRVRAFAAAIWGCAHARPAGNLSQAEILRRIAEFRPTAPGTYVEPYTTDDSCVTDKYAELALPAYRVSTHTVDTSFIAIRDPATVKYSARSRLARVGPECLLKGYARPDPESLDEQLSGIVKRLSVGKILLSDEWKQKLETEVWPEMKRYLETHAFELDIIKPDAIYQACEDHVKAKGYGKTDAHDYLLGVSLFLQGANGLPNLLPPEWRTEFGCFTKSENYALSGRKPCRSIQCPDLYVRGYQHALLYTAQHNLFVKLFPHLSIKHKTEQQKIDQIRSTFANTHRIVCTDLTAMEKNVTNYMMTFEKEVFKACSPVWMHPALDDAWGEMMTKSRSIQHKMFDLFVDPMRASGEDHTSAGNFVCNLMWICAWTGDTKSILNGSRPCMVEGDDGQVSADGLDLPDAKSIAGLGIRIKLEETVDASAFVSKVIKHDHEMCDPLGIAQNFSIIRDPDLNTSHTDAAKQYAMAMSYYYLYGGFPIVGPYFLKYLIRHHDQVMGTARGIEGVRRAFDKWYMGWMAPETVEAMWQDVLVKSAAPMNKVKTTAAELAEYCGVPQQVLERIYECRCDFSDEIVPSGNSWTVDDAIDAVKVARQNTKAVLAQATTKYVLEGQRGNGIMEALRRVFGHEEETVESGVYADTVIIRDPTDEWANHTILPRQKVECATSLIIKAILCTIGVAAWCAAFVYLAPIIVDAIFPSVPIAGLLDYEPAPLMVVPDILTNVCRFCEEVPEEQFVELSVSMVSLVSVWMVNIGCWIAMYVAVKYPSWRQAREDAQLAESLINLFAEPEGWENHHGGGLLLHLEDDEEW